MKIYVIVYDMFDGECSYNRIIKAFMEKKDAEEHAALCKAESERIHKECDDHYKKYKDEIESVLLKMREYVYANAKLKILDKNRVDVTQTPEAKRNREIMEEEHAIIKSHKYDPDFMSLEDEYCYNIEEVEMD